jgi:hypothetical protein
MTSKTPHRCADSATSPRTIGVSAFPLGGETRRRPVHAPAAAVAVR